MFKPFSLFLLCLFGIASVGCNKTTYLAFTVQGDSQMNNGGHFAIVRVYQLANDTKFSNSEFEAFWQNDEALLAEEMIPGTKQQFSIYPGQPIPHNMEVMDGARFIGFAANLYEPDGDQWRKLYPVELLEESGVTIWIRENQLVVDLP